MYFGNTVRGKEAVEISIERILSSTNGCKFEHLNVVFDVVLQDKILPLVSKLRQLRLSIILPRIDRPETEVILIFLSKLENYKNLSTDEIYDIATGLEQGFYGYTSFEGIKIERDLKMAITLWTFLGSQNNDYRAYYRLAKLQQYFDKELAFKTFEMTAKEKYTDGEIWLGTYYACNKKMKEAYFWLNRAKRHEPEYVQDILMEILELGEPTDCVGGWPG